MDATSGSATQAILGYTWDELQHSGRQHSTLYCCDRHADPDFRLSAFFLGDIYTGQLKEQVPTATKRKRTRVHYRAKEDRLGLFDMLLAWRNETHAHDPDRFARPTTWLLDDDGLDLLSKIHPGDISSAQNLTNLLQETPKWEVEFGQQIFNAIRQFDRARVKQAINTGTARLAKRPRNPPTAHTNCSYSS